MLLCICVGAVVVGWRAALRSASVRELAQIRAQDRAAQLAASLNRALAATETLAVLVRQGNGELAGFQQIGLELLPVYPGLIALELQPGGITVNVVPRTGNERSLGKRLLGDATANLALQSRKLALSGPLILPNGQPGVIGRLPVFLRDTRGKESFWGFISASVGMPVLISRAEVNDLPAQGYEYNLYAVLPAPLKPLSIAHHGNFSIARAVEQPIRIANLDLRLAVYPVNGYLHLAPCLWEMLVVLLLAGGCGLLLKAREKNNQLMADWAQSQERLDREKERANQLEIRWSEQLRSAEAASAVELQSTRTAAENTRNRLVEVENELRARRDRCSQLETDLHRLKTASATELDAARQATDSLQDRLREKESQLLQQKDDYEAGQKEWRNIQERAEVNVRHAKAAEETALSRLGEAGKEMQQYKEKLAQVEQELRQARAQTEAAAEASPGIVLSASVEPEPHGPRSETPRPGSEVEVVTAEPSVPAAREESAAALEAEPATAVTLDLGTSPESDPEPSARLEKTGRRRKNKDSGQLNLFAMDSLSAEEAKPIPDLKPEVATEPEAPASPKPSITRAVDKSRGTTPPPLNLPVFKKAANVLYPLLAEADPGAKDCLADHRKELRPAFSPETFEEFEKHIKTSTFPEALELLTKAARRHGITL